MGSRVAGKVAVNPYDRLQKQRKRIIILSVLIFIGAVIADLAYGSSRMGIDDILRSFWQGPYAQGAGKFIIWDIRLPMTLTSVFVGGSLGVAGLQLQTITNNPLASPYTFGITASAGFGAAIAITFGFSLFQQLWLGTAVLAFLFALVISLLIFYLGKLRNMSTTTLVLAGIVMNFFFTALQQFLQYRASAEVAQIISSWMFGNLGRSSWTSVAVSSVLLVFCMLFFMKWSWRLTTLSIGEEKAESLGIQTGRLRFTVFGLSALLISGAVTFIGTVAFVGLIAPHCARLLAGEDQRYLAPLSLLFGSILMVCASLLSKWLSVGSMLPVGIVTSVIGVPFLFILLMRKKEV